MKEVVRGGAYRYLLVAVAVASAGIALLLYATGLFHDTELASVDTRFSIRGDERPRDDIVLVLIDDVTSRELPVRFPFPRSLHARVIDAVNRDGAKTIAYDVEFLQPTQPKQDNALIDSVARAGPNKVVLADSHPDPQGRSGVFGGQQVLDDIKARAGNSQIGEDSDGVRRRIPYEVGNMKTFPLVAAEVASGRTITEGQIGGPSAWIDYAGGPGTYTSIPFSRVLSGQFPPGFFKDKVVVVGASDPNLKDIAETSVSRSDLMSGPEINANAIATALDDFPLRSTPLGFDLFLIALMGVIAPLASYRLSPIRALALGLLAAALYLVCAQLAFNSGRIVPVFYPMIALGLSLVGSLLVYYLREAFIRQRVRDTFARFVPESVVGQVLARDRRRPPPGGCPHGRHRPVQRHPGFHDLLGVPGSGSGAGGAERVPRGDDLGRHGPRRHPDLLHGRRNHGHVRRADRDGRPRRSRLRGGKGDARGQAAEGERMDAGE